MLDLRSQYAVGQAEVFDKSGATRPKRGTYYVQENEDGTESYFFGPLRFLNHARPANAELTRAGLLFALRLIRSGEEITIDYGDSFEASLED